MGSEGWAFSDIAINGIGKFLPLADEVGELLCMDIVYCGNTVMEVSVLLQGIYGILEMVVGVFRAGGKVEKQAQKKSER